MTFIQFASKIMLVLQSMKKGHVWLTHPEYSEISASDPFQLYTKCRPTFSAQRMPIDIAIIQNILLQMNPNSISNFQSLNHFPQHRANSNDYASHKPSGQLNEVVFSLLFIFVTLFQNCCSFFRLWIFNAQLLFSCYVRSNK